MIVETGIENYNRVYGNKDVVLDETDSEAVKETIKIETETSVIDTVIEKKELVKVAKLTKKVK